MTLRNDMRKIRKVSLVNIKNLHNKWFVFVQNSTRFFLNLSSDLPKPRASINWKTREDVIFSTPFLSIRITVKETVIKGAEKYLLFASDWDQNFLARPSKTSRVHYKIESMTSHDLKIYCLNVYLDFEAMWTFSLFYIVTIQLKLRDFTNGTEKKFSNGHYGTWNLTLWCQQWGY